MNVKIGLGTIVGYALTALGGAATAWATAEGTSSHIKPGLLAALTVAAGILTTLGRQYQGGKALEVPEVHDALAPGTSLTEAATTVPQDGVDSPAVARSGA